MGAVRHRRLRQERVRFSAGFSASLDWVINR